MPLAVQAESDFNTGNAANLPAVARLDFSIAIPKIVFLQVGTGTLFVDDTTIDVITFNVPAANVGDGSNIAGTGGNLGSGQVTMRVIGNNGNMSLGVAGPVAGLDSAGDKIPWSEILVAAGGTAPAHPAINGAASTLVAVNKVVNLNGTWTYTYDNVGTYAAGTYTGRLTYTATVP
jgi:hypothetical protein